jgi:hypothetical protein
MDRTRRMEAPVVAVERAFRCGRLAGEWMAATYECLVPREGAGAAVVRRPEAMGDRGRWEAGRWTMAA